MSLWNPMNVFPRPEANGPSSDYEPSQTGDPVREHPGRTSLGYGQAYVGRTSTVLDRPRNPIGFAPPQEPERDEPARFRTEITFRRHHESPRASVVSDPTDEPRPSWETPSSTAHDEFPAQPSASFEEIAEESVPFYRREISFRRTKVVEPSDPGEPVDVADDALAPSVNGIADEAGVEHEAPEAVVEVEADPVAETVAVHEPAAKRR